MHECQECKFFWSEPDVNANGCKKEGDVTDEMWEGKVECPFFSGQEELED